MDTKIDFALKDSAVELLRPQSLSTDVRKRSVLDLISGRSNFDNLNPAVSPSLGRLDGGSHLARLCKRQRRSTSPEAESLHMSTPSAIFRDQAKGRARNDCDPRP